MLQRPPSALLTAASSQGLGLAEDTLHGGKPGLVLDAEDLELRVQASDREGRGAGRGRGTLRLGKRS